MKAIPVGAWDLLPSHIVCQEPVCSNPWLAVFALKADGSRPGCQRHTVPYKTLMMEERGIMQLSLMDAKDFFSLALYLLKTSMISR